MAEVVEPIRSKENIRAMKKELRNPRDHLMFVMGINSALRISDLLQLRVRDVVDEDGKLTPFYRLREKKTGKAKKIPFSKNVQKALAEYLKDFNGDWNQFLFKSKGRNKAISLQHAWWIIKEAARKVGIKDNIGTHSMRKTFAYHAYKGGINLYLLMEMLNHSAPFVTRRYIGITQDEMDEVVINLNL